ncbi:GNAT family N-acetyltransferase [Streptomyces platensis]|uniref:GNAT family N-acetyltransferase n=1 Tax=Streptomyces platensis TaxID=58346 RepID=UPI001F1EB85E|nr:GNAT family N-acetyltransferase [Streptomyces platensis]MCF3145878.1 GNAT family N-acetyltransferase [Streptomyces platensis]
MNIDTGAWFAVLAAARAHDRPDGPALEPAAETGRLRIPALHSRAIPVTLPAPDGATGYAGVALLRLNDTEENAGNAFLDTLTVHPAHRGRGVGRALWETVCGRLAAEGRTSVSTLVEQGGAGERFAVARGAECALPMVAYVQDVRTAPATGVPLPAGYRFAAWSGVVPDTHAAAHARAHDAMEDAPAGDLDEQHDPWDAERIRAAARVVLDRGGVLLTVAVLAEADGAVAGYTELVLPTPDSVQAVQYDTVVVPAHRGRGLGRAVKLRMLEYLRAQWPDVREIETTVADENTPMRTVNAALGYRAERPLGFYQVRL